VNGRAVRVARDKITTDIRSTNADLGAPVFNRSKELIGIVGVPYRRGSMPGGCGGDRRRR